MFCISNLIWNEEEGKKASLVINIQFTVLMKRLILHHNKYLQCTAQWDPKHKGRHHYRNDME